VAQKADLRVHFPDCIKTETHIVESPKKHSLMGKIKENILPILSTIIALCALGLSFYGGYETRQHNRLSVKPQVAIDFWLNEEEAGWRIQNDGLGPGEVRAFEVKVDGKTEHTWTDVLRRIGIKRISKI
jgi:hypothetical protein